MFSFEGDFKRTPKVSLGGASKKVRPPPSPSPPVPQSACLISLFLPQEQKASLLHRTQEERRKREVRTGQGS